MSHIKKTRKVVQDYGGKTSNNKKKKKRAWRANKVLKLFILWKPIDFQIVEVKRSNWTVTQEKMTMAFAFWLIIQLKGAATITNLSYLTFSYKS